MNKPDAVTPDISKVFTEGNALDEAIRMSVHQALLAHKRAGNPIAVERNGKIIMLKPEAIPA
jgi:isoaspartyl peptidase/L-asparaginase-like protein (Ntn-hydrolase superfamily)